ncbi:MAG TPA: hypothetical protein VJ783_07370 [Pirellulales bacterium]|nr:hypothetical protein [Pirellulales bacterium]
MALAAVLLLARSAGACSVPVFRYALEHWPADLFEVDVFFRGALTPEQRALVSQLEDQSQINGGAVNCEVIHCNLHEELADDLHAVGDTLGDVPLPHVVLRRPGGRRGSAVVWSGPLSKVKPSLWTSPARDELIERLATGDSVVWLVFHGSDETTSQQVVEQLRAELPRLAAEIPLPVADGLPESELLTKLPLDIRFSVLEVAGKSADEVILRNLVTCGVVDDLGDDETIVVPVFGRGRAMTVLKAESIDEALLAECSGFLCGACSCQVKQSNPGFDLLLAVNWDERLWAQSDTQPPPAQTQPVANTGDEIGEPSYVPIPAGRKEAAPSEPQKSAVLPADSQPGHAIYWAALGVAALAIGVVLGYRRISATSRE